MAKINLEKKSLWLGMAFVLAAGLLVGFFISSLTSPPAAAAEKIFAEKSIDEQKIEVAGKIDIMKDKLKADGKYACCIMESCNECLLDEGECTCAKDVKDGKAPCGECIGEILEGNGDPNLAKYFATAISKEVGEQHLDALKQIISEKYGIQVEEQV